MRFQFPTAWVLGGGALLLAIPEPASAIPPFARRYEMSCNSCHQGHYPRLNAFGRQFRDNGYQLPEGAEEFARAVRNVEISTPSDDVAVFKEVPLSLRGEVFELVPVDSETLETSTLQTSLFSFLLGGGTVAKDVSFFFTWTPFPDPGLHQARIGYHNIAKQYLGSGALNLRAGALFLLDFQRPGHRFLAAGPASATQVTVGQNTMSLEDANPGVELYGRPGWGPFHYEVALVAGDTGGEGELERDDNKDVFARGTWTFAQNTNHEVTPGVWGYVGRSDIDNTLGGLTLSQRDEFWMLGGDIEVDIGMLNLSGTAYAREHSDPLLTGEQVTLMAGRGEALYVLAPKWVTSARYEQVVSEDLPTLDQQNVAAHLTYLVAQNALITAVWRHDLVEFDRSSAVLVLDATF